MPQICLALNTAFPLTSPIWKFLNSHKISSTFVCSLTLTGAVLLCFACSVTDSWRIVAYTDLVSAKKTCKVR